MFRRFIQEIPTILAYILLAACLLTLAFSSSSPDSYLPKEPPPSDINYSPLRSNLSGHHYIINVIAASLRG